MSDKEEFKPKKGLSERYLCTILGHNPKLVYTEPEVREYSDGHKSSKRKWIDHIVCETCNKKWYPPTDEEIKSKQR